MAKDKEKSLREKMIENVAMSLMNHFEMSEIVIAKEGLVMGAGGETFVIKVIQKKKPVLQADVKGEYVLDKMVVKPAAEGAPEDTLEEEEAVEEDEVFTTEDLHETDGGF